MSHRLGNLKPFVREGPALGKGAQLGMASGQEGTREHGRQVRLAEALTAPRPLKGRHGLPIVVDGHAR